MHELTPIRPTDTTGLMVYVANPSLAVGGVNAPQSSVVMLDARDLSIREVAQLDPQAIRLALTPDNSRLWVSHLPENKISVLNAATLETIEVIDLGLLGFPDSRPYGIAVRPASAVLDGSHGPSHAP